MVTWLPSTIAYCITTATPKADRTQQQYITIVYTNAVGALYGAILGIAFFLNSREARQVMHCLILFIVLSSLILSYPRSPQLNNTHLRILLLPPAFIFPFSSSSITFSTTVTNCSPSPHSFCMFILSPLKI